MIQQTSMESWGIIQRELGEKQFEVFVGLARMGQGTNNEIAHKLELPINRITPRIHELRHMGLVRMVGVRLCNITKFRAKVWEVVEYEHAIKQFRRYLDGQKRLKEKGETQKEFFL